ncbi:MULTISPECIES: DNA glycosylase AlkZ-like family protein [unclassified Actinotalea]|uniref:DNA glycosylase AlkZ-like family protein n=1 Tax=unclassified Actinotalea TaxID=2638618 RepID=UPI0015F6395E|nr:MULTISPECIES: crosslink repair DNA glycosylase YcaQ family protein [unclassified Actinotalea]
MTDGATASRGQALRRRAAAQGLDLDARGRRDRLDVLDAGVQDTGADAAAWALAVRGAPVDAGLGRDLALAWTLRGAPHVYRRADLPAAARALAPFSEEDARRRLQSAAAPLVADGQSATDALVVVGRAMREVTTGPTAKGEVSSRLTPLLPQAYVRWCAACGTTHTHESLFRLAALHAGLELEPRTSPPVLTPVAGWRGHLDALPALVAAEPRDRDVPARLDTVRAYLHLHGPARPADVAAHLEAPVADVRRHWASLADELAEVDLEGERRWLLAGDLDALERAREAPAGPARVHLLGPSDPFLQARDRELLVPDAAARSDLWRALGRPGAVLRGGEVVGTWRPRATGSSLRLQVRPSVPWDRRAPDLDAAVDDEAERLATFRGLRYAGRAE